MEENEITYIPYGQDEISQQDLMTSLADGVESYLGSKRWAKKDKYRQAWLNAYQDIINRGITGASNDSGIWKINHKGDNFTLDTMSNTEREMYQDAAYYIQQKMAQMTPRKKEEEKKKEDLEKFGNFRDNLMKRILNGRYGGEGEGNKALFLDPEQGWDAQDARGADGLRGTTKRREAMIAELKAYKRDLDNQDLNYNFEGTAFKDKADLQTKIQTAIDALENTPDDESDDLPAFSALGLPYKAFFNNGGNDTYGTTEDGKQITYQQYYESKQKADKEKADKLALANVGVLSTSSGNKAIDAIYNTDNYNQWLSKTYGVGQQGFNKINQRVQNLLEKSYNHGKANGLTPAERKELGNLIYYIRTNNPKYQNYNLTTEEEMELNKHNSMKGRNLKDFIRLPWNTSDGRYTYSDKSGNIYFLKPENKQKLQAPTFVRSQAYNNYIKNFGKTKEQINNEQSAKNMNTPLSQMTEWTPEMKKEIEAIAWDAASILDPEAFSGSAMALYASRLRDEANPNRGALEKWFDRGTAALGGIQGVGDLLVTGKLGYKLYQLGKSIGSVSKFAGILGAGFGAVGAYEAKDSIAKIANPDSLTPQDLENIAYGLMGLIGLKSFAKARNKQTIGKQANPTTTEYNITVKDKNNKTHEIKIDEAAAKEIQQVRTLGKKKETVDSEILNMPKIKESIQKYKEANPTKNLEIEGASIVNDSKSAFGRSGRNKMVTSNQVKNPNAPEYVPVGTRWYNPFGYMAQGNNKWGYYLGGGWQRRAWENAAPEHSPRGLWQRAKEFWSPEPKVKNEVSSTKPSTENSNTTEKKTWAEIEKEPKKWSQSAEAKEYKEMLKGNYSNNAIQGGTHKIGDLTINVDIPRPGATNGFAEVTFSNGNKQTIKFDNQRQLQEQIAKIVKERRVQIDSSGKKTKVDVKEMSKILKSLKARGFLKQGGTINSPYIDNVIEDFFKNNNI